MIISRQALNKIKEIIDKNYKSLLLNIVGNNVFTEDELAELEAAGFDVSNEKSLLEMVYYNNVLNEMKSADAPNTIGEMRRQQVNRPVGTAHTSAEEHINESFRHVVDKLKASVQSQFEGVIRDNNLDYRSNALQNLDRPDHLDQLVKESTVGGLKRELARLGQGINKDWERIAITETSNAIGMGSADRVIAMNKDKKPSDIYVYRVVVPDSALCRHCRKFYLDSDGSPKLYRMSTMLNNGTNYGKKTVDWNPVIGATHPNERCSGILELRPGWKLAPGGSVEFIGIEEWPIYIENKVEA